LGQKKSRSFDRLFYQKFGGVHPMIVEHPLSIIRLYREKWIREKFSIERETLARLHFDVGLTNKELAERFNVSATTIKVRLYGMDRTGNKKAK
jgi:DNA-binding NarL/FixJ family response regulator